MKRLDNEFLQAHLPQNIELTLLDSIDSTNQYLKSHSGSEQIHICLAEQQTAGKGRRNSVWHSPPDVNIYYSCLYVFPNNLNEVSGLSLVVSLAIAKTLREFSKQDFLVKWPNDVFYDNQKIAGSLIDGSAINQTTTKTIMGIGINVNMQDANNSEISQPWTSLQKIVGKEIDRNLLVVELTKNLLPYLKKFSATGLTGFIDEWEQYDFLKGRKVSINTVTESIQGIAQGINASGLLIVKTAEGNLRTLVAGDVELI